MTKKEADKFLTACRRLGLEMTIKGGNKPDEYEITFFHQSKLTYSNALAARMFLMSVEMETGKRIG